MFAEPSEEDFVATLTERAQEAAGSFGSAVGEILAQNSAAGRLHSGLTVRLVLREMISSFEQGCGGFFTELMRFRERTSLDAGRLRVLTETHLRRFAEVLAYAAQQPLDGLQLGGAAQAVVGEQLNELGPLIDRRLRQFDVGLWEGKEPPVTSNTINVDTVVGGIQQGTHGSSMHVQVAVDINAVEQAANELEAALVGCAASGTTQELQGDLDTIKGQVRKSSPGVSILRETGKSIRAIAENVAAGVLTPKAIAAASALAATLGA